MTLFECFRLNGKQWKYTARESGAQNHGYSAWTGLQDFPWAIDVWITMCQSGKWKLRRMKVHPRAMPQTQEMTPHPVTVYRHRAELSWCYPLMWNVTLEYTTTRFILIILISWVRPNHHHTQMNSQLYDVVMVIASQKLGRKCTAPTGSWTQYLGCANSLRYPLAGSCFSDSILFLTNRYQKHCLWYCNCIKVLF